MNCSAVIIGDLVRSRSAQANRLEEAMRTLRNASTAFGETHQLSLRFTRYRGDGWQIVLTDPQLSLNALLFFLARLRACQSGIKTRMSVGIGSVESLGTNDLSDATGTAFFISGNNLDRMSRKRMISIAGHGIGASQIAIIDLAEYIASGWTAAQAEAVAMSLQANLPTHEDIAANLGVTRQAVQSRLAGAGLSFFENALLAMRNHDYTAPIEEQL